MKEGRRGWGRCGGVGWDESHKRHGCDNGDTKEHNFAGTAILIKNKWNNIIKDVQPRNQRIATTTLNSTMPVTFINAYAPTAQSSFAKKLEKPIGAR